MRDVFLRLLGGVFVVAFLSLLAQITVLVGSRGLLPAGQLLIPARRFLDAPTIFWLDHHDGTLVGAAVTGAGLGVALALGVAPRWCLAALWALYLSFVTIEIGRAHV